MRSVGATLVKLIATATSGLVSFTTNVIRPVKVTCEFSPVQEGTGDPSPDNVRPIGGWTGCEIEQRKENLITQTPLRKITGARTSGGKIVGDNYLSLFVYKIPKETLYLRHPGNSYIYYGFSDNPNLSIEDSLETREVRWGSEVTIADNSYKYIYITDTKAKAYFDRGSLSVASSPSILPADVGMSLPITFTDPSTGDPLTVYGGTVTLNEDGSADVIATYNGYDLGNLNYAKDATNFFRMTFNQLKSYFSYVDDIGETYGIKCSIYKTGKASGYSNIRDTGIDYMIYGRSSTKEIYIRDSRYNDIASLKAALAGEMIVIPLADPITYHVTASQLKSFLGTNNIWSDLNGSITAEYWKKQ